MTFGLGKKPEGKTLKEDLAVEFPQLEPAKLQQALDMAERAGIKPDWKKQATPQKAVKEAFPFRTSGNLKKALDADACRRRSRFIPLARRH
jgi:hypothetical protein